MLLRVTRMLRDTMDFEIIEVNTDLDWDSFDQGLDKFYRTLKGADIGLFYFSGHGMRDEKGSGNYLLPVDARISKDSHIRKHGFRVGDILEGMNLSGVKTSLLFLDACRDNPFGTGSKGGKRGLIKLDKPPPRSLIAFAAEYGHTADDGDGNHGPYTEALLKHLPTKNAPLLELMGRVREEVFEATGHAQSPIEENRLTKPVYLAGQNINVNDSTTSSPASNVNPQAQIVAGTNKEIILWNEIKDSSDTELFELYLSEYPNGVFSGLAKLKIARIKKETELPNNNIAHLFINTEPENAHIRILNIVPKYQRGMALPIDTDYRIEVTAAGFSKYDALHTLKVGDQVLTITLKPVQETLKNKECSFELTDSYGASGVFTGVCLNGKAHGHGELNYVNGNHYIGQFKKNLRDGQGTFTFKNGSKYVGQYKDDKKTGYGTHTYANGDKYVGEFKDGKRDGHGTYTYASGSKYVGQYKDGKINGQGTYSYTSGEKYVGQYKDNKRNGHGTYTYANGGKYVGQHKDSKRHGQGTFTYANGEVDSGIWFEGEFTEN